MFLSVSFFAAAVSVIPLDGVVGAKLSPRADFDAYNVNVGDPMILTVDFIGEADFGALHPPALSEAVDPAVWKVDDKSAKTDTYRDARRITYRVRPVREGALEFPSLAFSYRHHKTGETVEVSTSPIPVNSKKSSQVALSGLDDLNVSLPPPDGITVDLSSSPWGSLAALGDDDLFAWRKACALAEAEGFSRFDFPEARLNEAACEILAGNWARALSIYSSLEWKIGQTVAIERGIVAAIALKTSDPGAELPMWRRVMRPVLRHSWKGRTLYAVGALLSIGVVFVFLRAILRLIVCVAAAIIFSQSAFALNPFAEMERMHEEMMREMNSMRMNMPGGIMSVNGVEMDRAEITAEVSIDKPELTVGEPFSLTVSLESPKDCTLSGIRINPSRTLGLVSAGGSENLPDVPGSSTNRVVRRMSIPLRYDVPFKGDVSFSINGMCDRVIRNGNFRSSFSTSFSVKTDPLKIEVKLLDGVEVPEDYNGCIAERLSAHQRPDVREVETNDVVSVIVTVRGEDAFIPENAFSGQLGRDRGSVVFKRLFRACGELKTPDISFSYYNPSEKGFRRVTAGGVPLRYVSRRKTDAENVVINAAKGAVKTVLRFAPRESAREIASTVKRAEGLKITETVGEWVRVDDGTHAGWVKKKDLKKD